MINPLAPVPWEYDEDLLEIFECFALGSYVQDQTFEVECLGICQRPGNPCIVDIDFKVEGTGEYEIVPELCMFSLDTTNGIDGTWHLLQPIETDPQHSGRFITVNGERICRFVADMCDHVSTFFSEPRICFRITLREKVEEDSTFGGFDASRNPTGNGTDPEVQDPLVARSGGCRSASMGPRLPRL